MIYLLSTAIISSVLIAGVVFSPLLSGQFHLVYAQNNTTRGSSGNSVTISPGSSSPSNEKFFVPDTLTVSKGTTVSWTNGGLNIAYSYLGKSGIWKFRNRNRNRI